MVQTSTETPSPFSEAHNVGFNPAVPTDWTVFPHEVGGALDELAANIAATGQTNTASNQGVDGVGVYDTKVGVDLQFRHVAPASAKITTVLNGKDIDVDVVEAQLSLANLGTRAITDLSDVGAKSGVGTTVLFQTAPTLTTPIIGNFTGSQHAHLAAASGGLITDASWGRALTGKLDTASYAINATGVTPVIPFELAGVEKCRVDANGNLCVNATLSPQTYPNLYVYQDNSLANDNSGLLLETQSSDHANYSAVLVCYRSGTAGANVQRVRHPSLSPHTIASSRLKVTAILRSKRPTLASGSAAMTRTTISNPIRRSGWSITPPRISGIGSL
jgi:hypothetical protein